MDRMQLIEAQREASQALEAGTQMAKRWATMRRGANPGDADKPSGAALGVLLASPAAFWSGAAVCASVGDADAVAPVGHAVKYAAARLAVGDFDFVRESLVGQAQWLSALAVTLGAQASDEKNIDRMIPKMKLALAAQRQAAQALATAAALNRITSADAVTVGDC